MKDGIKILSIGNSFSEDTMEHIPEIVKSLGYKDFKFANLYIGGCSIKKHYNLMVNDIAEYEYYVNSGDGWTQTQHFTSREKIKEEDWDIISIQHGTGDKSRYTSPESYADLPALIKEVKALSKKDVKIAFNMAWVAEPESTPTILDILPPVFAVRIVVMAGVITLMYFLSYLPWLLKDRKAKKAVAEQQTKQTEATIQ